MGPQPEGHFIQDPIFGVRSYDETLLWVSSSLCGFLMAFHSVQSDTYSLAQRGGGCAS